MTRLGVVFWGGLVLASGFATFNVKYAVQGIDDELDRVREQTVAEQQEIRVPDGGMGLSEPAGAARRAEPQLPAAHPDDHEAAAGRGSRRLRCARRRPGVPRDAVRRDSAELPRIRLRRRPLRASPVPPGAAAPARAVRAGGTPAAEAQTAEAPAGTTRSADAQGTAAEARRSAGRSAPRGQGDRAGRGAAPARHRRRRQSLRARLAKVAPITAAQAAEAPVADAASGGARPADASAEGAAALAEALHLLGSDGGGQTPRVRLAKAAPASLDALISKIANTR